MCVCVIPIPPKTEVIRGIGNTLCIHMGVVYIWVFILIINFILSIDTLYTHMH